MLQPLSPKSLVNGKAEEAVSIFDRGLMYGDGLFETIRVHQGKLSYWTAHMARLQAGCQRLALEFPGKNILVTEARSLIGKTQNGVLKITLTRGIGARGYRAGDTTPTRIVSIFPGTEGFPANQNAIGLTTCQQRLAINPALAGIKHLNRLEQVLARSEWDDEFDEGVMLDMEDRVIEGTMSNIFLLSEGSLITPELTRCGVAGIMRQQILREADALNMDTEIRDVQLAELEHADELFVCNSIIGIWPVQTFASKVWESHPVTDSLRMALELA